MKVAPEDAFELVTSITEVALYAVREAVSAALPALTGNRAILCVRDEALAPKGGYRELLRGTIWSPEDVRSARVRTGETAASLFNSTRACDIALAMGELAANTLVHGGGGGWCVAERNGAIRLMVWDSGEGLPLAHVLPATLAMGWSTKDSAGMGLPLVVRLANRIWLSPGLPGGGDGLSIAAEFDLLPLDDEESTK